MARRSYSVFQSVNQAIASTRPAAWLFARTMPLQDRLVLKLSGGRWTLTGLLTGLPVVWVTTTGAKSGKPRTVPLLGIPDPGGAEDFALIGTNWGRAHYPAWYFNLRAAPRATCTVRGQSRACTAHEASGEEYERYWQRATQVYRGYPLYKQRVRQRAIPILVLKPAEA